MVVVVVVVMVVVVVLMVVVVVVMVQMGTILTVRYVHTGGDNGPTSLCGAAQYVGNFYLY